MTTTIVDSFSRKWAENSTITPWTTSQYQAGWAVVGDAPPTVAQFDAVLNELDEKNRWLFRQVQDVATARGVTLEDATSNVLADGIINLSNSVNSMDTDIAASSLAVKTAYDKAVAAQQSVDNIDVSAMPFFGGSQSYQDVTSARAMNVVYTNSTKPIFVVVTFKNDINSSDIGFAVKINSVSIVDSYINTAGNSPDVFATFVVPAGATYEITNSSRVLNPTSIKNIWEMS